MSVFKSLVDRVQAKKDELEKKAAKKAAEKATEMAIERGKEAALAAVAQAGETLKSAGASIEEALFGPDSEEQKGEPERAGEREEPAEKARSAERRRPATAPAARAHDEERFQREVDDELAALKRKIARE